jgi:hypothetical protein
MIYSLWILLSSWLVCTGWVLSLLKQLNAGGYLVALILFGVLIYALYRQRVLSESGKPFRPLSKLARRFRRPLPLVYLIYLIAALVGGALYPPTNYDALCYRLPRILHWWSQGGWHWIGGYNVRMDYSATGFEWLAAPLLILFKTDRLLFLINAFSYALLPGLTYSLLVGLGIKRRVAWYWMWILPTAYCFALQAGSISNDMFATVYFLTSAVFALRAVRTSSWTDAALSILSAALMTGAKASNLPLLLPLAFLMLGMARMLARKPWKSLVIVIIACGVSFMPIAIMNIRHTGDWTGDPRNSEKMKISNPVVGLAGNSLQMIVGSLVPPVFPLAKAWSASAERLFEKEPLRSLRDQYPRVGLSAGELATEEGAGIGLGLLILCCVGLAFSISHSFQGGFSRSAMIFGLLCWIALFAFMAKLGSESAARLAAPYYAGILIPLLALRSQGLLVAKRWWRLLAAACALSVLPALLLNPSRPLIPVPILTATAKCFHVPESIVVRIRSVYSVYGNRSDSLAELRGYLPIGSKTIGFAGTGNDSEYSFWKPLGGRDVTDLNPVDGKVPDLDGIEVIVGSEWGINDRYHMKADELAACVDGKILWQGKIATMAGREPMIWYIIIPSFGRYFLKDKS